MLGQFLPLGKAEQDYLNLFIALDRAADDAIGWDLRDLGRKVLEEGEVGNHLLSLFFSEHDKAQSPNSHFYHIIKNKQLT